MAHGKARLTRDGDVAIITMDDPATRNALSWAMGEDLLEALDNLGDARALLIAAEGKGFCSGGDLTMGDGESRTIGDIVKDGLADSINPMLRKLAALEIPVVSAVNGAAAGAGAPFALSADFCIAGESAFFYFAFPNVGLALDAGASWLMPRLVGTQRALEALMLAERIPAEKALDWGMIYKVVPDDQLQEEGLALAKKLAAGPTVSYGQIRQAVRFAQASGYSDALTNEETAQQVAGSTGDCQEAIMAFLQKRAPEFKGK